MSRETASFTCSKVVENEIAKRSCSIPGKRKLGMVKDTARVEHSIDAMFYIIIPPRDPE